MSYYMSEYPDGERVYFTEHSEPVGTDLRRAAIEHAKRIGGTAYVARTGIRWQRDGKDIFSRWQRIT